MNHSDLTIKTYDDSADQFDLHFSDYFGQGPRISDIKKGLELVGKNQPVRVVEIGCGTGRDAKEIVKLVDWYEGFDPSKGLLEVAKNKVPGASFVLADALSYIYPKDLDIIFAFASLLHIDRENLEKVFPKALESLRSGGIFYISLKEADEYKEALKTDRFGDRMFYYYNPKIIVDMAGDDFELIYEDHQQIGTAKWFNIALKKI